MLLLLFGLAIAELCTPSRLNIPGDARSVLTLRYAIFSVDERSSGPCGVYAVEYATGETTRLSTACGADIISFEKPSFWAFRADGVIHLVENNNTLLIGALTYPGLRSMTWGGGLFLICTSNVDACIFRQGHQNGTDVGLIVVESGHVDAQIGSLFFRRLLSSNPTMEPLFFSADNRFVWCLSDNARRLSVIWLFDSTEVQIQIPGGRGGVLSSPQRLGNSVVFVATDAPRVFIQAFTDGRVRMFNDVQASIPDFAIVQNWIPYSASNGMTVVLVSGSNSSSSRQVILAGVSESIAWPLAPPMYRDTVCERSINVMDFDRGLIVCNNSVLAVPLLNEATNDNFFSSDPVTFEQVSDIRGTALNRVFVIGKLKGRSGGNDLVRLSMFARSLFMSVLLTRSAPISDLSFAGAGAGLVYTRNGVANAGISAGTSRRMFGFGTYDEEVHEVLAGENAVVFANPQPGNGVSVVFLDNAQMYWRGCLVGPIIVNRTDGVPVTLPPTASSVVPGDLELRMGVLELNLSKPLSVRGSLVLAREGRVVLRDCVPGTYQISANIIMGPFNASCECSSGMRAFALQTASTLSVSVSQASDTSDCAATIAKSATLSPGVIAGIAVAACVVAVLAVLGAVFLMRRSAAKRTEAANSAIMEDELEDLKQHLIENQ